MSKFGWVFLTYIIYISVLLISNTLNIVNDKPVVALGFVVRWWFILLVFLVAYASEWLSIVMQRGE